MTEINQTEAFGADVYVKQYVNMGSIKTTTEFEGQVQWTASEEKPFEQIFISLGDGEVCEITYVDEVAYMNIAGWKFCQSIDSEEWNEYMASALESFEQPGQEESANGDTNPYTVDFIEELEGGQSRLTLTLKPEVVLDVIKVYCEAMEQTLSEEMENLIQEDITMQETIIFSEDLNVVSASCKIDIGEKILKAYYEVDEETDPELTSVIPSEMSYDINFTNITTTVDIQAPEDADEYYSMDDAGDDIFGDDMFGDVTGLPAVVA